MPANVRRRRNAQHQHALERLRERYMPDAEMADVLNIRDLAREAATTVKGMSMTDCKNVFIRYQGHLLHVVYVPRQDAVRTILPPR